MKTVTYYLGIIIAYFVMTGLTQAKSGEVKLKVNEEFIYEWTEKEVFFIPNQKPTTDLYKTSRFSLLVKKIDGNKICFTGHLLKKVDNFLQSNDLYAKEYAFPRLINHFWKMPNKDTPQEIIYSVEFNYELDLATNSIQLTNRPEILEQCYKILTTKGYSDQDRTETIDRINTQVLQQQNDVFLKPFLLVKANPDLTTITSDKLSTSLSIQKRSAETIELGSSPTDTTHAINCQLDTKTSLLTCFSETKKIDRPEKGMNVFMSPSDYKLNKINELSLIKRTVKKTKDLIVCGHIENPISDRVLLYTLNREFGTEMECKDVYLNKTGDFRIETNLKNKGLIVLMQPNNNQSINTEVFLLYAEPGDSIYVKTRYELSKIELEDETKNDIAAKKTKDIMMYKQVNFSGDRKTEAEFLMKYQQEWRLMPFNTTNSSMNSLGIRYNSRSLNPQAYLTALDKLQQTLSGYKQTMNTETATYLEHELQAFLYSQLFEVMAQRSNFHFLAKDLLPSTDQELNKIKTILDTVHVQRIYNDFGLFSRTLTNRFIWYKTIKAKPPRNILLSADDSYSLLDLEQTVQFTKMVLSGSALYRALAEQLLDRRFFPYWGKVWKAYEEETFDLMQKCCNDEAFKQEIETMLFSKTKWNNLRYVPEANFVDLNREKAQLSSFLTQKPTVVIASKDWSNARYEMDEMASKFPTINFVLINEGSNFDVWKDWNDRATPIAQQLFLQTDSANLDNLFQDKMNFFLTYNQFGERIGVEHELIPAIQLAKKSLKGSKKELNKSTLKIIILVLSGSIVFFLLLFLVYKFRMKQRLRKQMQEKRLRELQMAAIRAQMNPHFLFNSMNSVQNLIQQNRAQEAHLYLSDFAGLIRKVLRNSDKEEVSLAEELETLEQYLSLEKLRFDFEYTIQVDEHIDQSLFMLPSMILQPIAENALMHGLQHKNGDKKMSIQIKKTENSILITIEDNGIGIEEAKKLKTKSNGVGLRMNEERIMMMKEKHGGNYSFRLIDLTEQNGEGTRVEISIPDEI